MADTSFFDKVFPNGIGSAIGFPDSETFGKTVETVRDLPDDVLEFLRSSTPDTSVPLTVEDKIKQDFSNIPDYFAQGAISSAEYINDLLSADSPIVAGLKDGSLNEEDYNLDGIDLVQVLGNNLQTDMLPEEFKMVRPGQSNLSDPTGSGRIKARPTTMGEFELTGKNLEPYNPIGGIQTIDPELQSEAFGDLEFELEKEKQREIDAVNFRKQEEKLTQGGLNSMTIEESDKINAESKKMTQEQQEEGFLSAMDDFFEGARGAGPEVPKDRTIAEYKKAFSEATGIDTSGKVDKKDALMAFGLALMQNKAGKGFNVSKMLTEVGVAGDKALPALNKAKERARQGALAGGKYALQTQSSDKAVRAAAEEKMLNRDKVWVYKKGTEDKPFEGFDTGQFEDLNKYELDKLMKDPKFQEQYEYISASDRMTVLSKRDEARIAAQDKGDMWGGGERTSMLGGEANKQGELFQIFGAFKDSNYNGETPTTFNVLENAEHRVEQLLDAQENIIKQSNQLGEISSLIGEGVTFGAQIQADVVQFGRALGIDIGGKPSSVKLAQQKLQKIALQKATEILKESGKTLSDGDRKRVDEYVGKISKWTAGGTDAALLAVNLQNIYEIVVDQPQRDINQALDWLEENAGVKLGREEPRNSIFSPSSAEELVAFNKATGQNLTMKDFQ